MGYMIVNTDPQPDDQDWTKIKFGTELAACKHAKFLNDKEEDRKNA